MLAIAQKFSPPMPENKKMEYLYRNFRPDIKQRMRTNKFFSMEDLIEQATDAEALLHAMEMYREPPAPDKSLLPEYASKLSKIKSKLSVDEIEHLATQVSAIMQENILSMREIRTSKDARRSRNSSDSEASVASNSSRRKKTHRKKVYENKSGTSESGRTNYAGNTGNSGQQNQDSSQNNKEQYSGQSRGGGQYRGNGRGRGTQRGRGGFNSPPPSCLNCKKQGHLRANCPEPITLKCDDCGRAGVTKHQCPDCNKDQHQQNSKN